MNKSTASKAQLSTQAREAVALAVREMGDTMELISSRAPKIAAIARALKSVTDQASTVRELAGLIEDLAELLGDDVRSEMESTRQGLQELAGAV